MNDANDPALGRLWAPWRLEYIKNQGNPSLGCPFCELPLQGVNEETLILFSDDDFFVDMNKFPYNPGHLLVIPRKHTGKPQDLSLDVWQKLNLGLRLSLESLEATMKPQGFNMGMNLNAVGGAGIPEHMHWHIVPRWGGDTNFMPIIAETKTLPAHNLTVYRQLKPAFDDFATRLAQAKLKP